MQSAQVNWMYLFTKYSSTNFYSIMPQALISTKLKMRATLLLNIPYIKRGCPK